MAATDLYDLKQHIKPFVLNEAPGMGSRSTETVTQTGTALASGTILAKSDTGAGTFAMAAGSTGNPTSGAITVGAAAVPGVYRGVFQSATKFALETPTGVILGTGTLGSAFSAGGMGFTLTAGGTPAVAGDSFTITVAAGTNKLVAYTADRAAGPAVSILYNYLPAKTGDTKAVVFDMNCEVNRFELTGLDAAAEADLRALGIKVRGVTTPGVSTPAL